jgi:L-ascorbate metabolism protein UlaG (beta-lactamase superfamily)
VNGTGDTTNAWETTALAAQLRPGTAVPMHFGMWPDSGYGPDATLDPGLFADLHSRLSDGAGCLYPTSPWTHHLAHRLARRGRHRWGRRHTGRRRPRRLESTVGIRIEAGG